MVAELRALVERITGSAMTLSSATGEMSGNLAQVREVAQRTQTSAQEIEGMVKRLQHSAQQAADEMNRSRQGANDSMATASKAGEALGAITSAVDGISETMSQIAGAAEEQTAVAIEISRGILSISGGTRDASENMAELEQAGRGLEELAGDLRERAIRFQL
ncbi:methyl-accepting chemotaxis protein [Allochromatium tepidum]|uniref:Methyl-accepting transducer domain-containing protein n=1 Tax=Allochromatium tepidum TaxID=553982 RepID=A0ABN6GDD8_9GAMM|nr:methyl-accepting chemotaxis protein [Allochromatium tepidum]BCU07904.1 hypothetical protein Atep_25810 [Allochromatium tepidum]